MPHIHGLGFSPDGRQLIVPAHDGLRSYADGKWQSPDVPAHDYMGFTPASDGFYSSGHPDPLSGLVNPFGLVKSTDGGQTLIQLGFEGETDFHFMAVGYQNHAIYVGNPAANSQLQPGIHYSLDDGKTWQQSTLQGLTAQPIQMVVHPLEANVVALATEDGVFLSTDHGNSFTRIGERGPVSAVAFNPDGKSLLFGYQQVSSYDLASQQMTALPSPTLAAEDAIGYIAANPVRLDEIALATFSKDIYLSSDRGQSWTQIVDDGNAS
jgi:WD40 repeat protein